MTPLFLLGAGASMSVGLPGVERITEHVLSGDHVVRNSVAQFVIDAAQRERSETVGTSNVDSVREAVRVVREGRDLVQRSFDFYRIERVPTYEDIASMVAQIHESLSSETFNPALLPLIEGLPSRGSEYSTALDYIRGVVSGCVGLDRLTSGLDSGFAYLHDALQSEDPGPIHLVTLNHDRLIESALSRWGMPYSDGFGDEVDGGVWFWNDGFEDDRLHLIKLHGSIDWLVGTHPVDSCRGRAPCRSTDAFSSIHGAYDPMFLAGTTNKILSYQYEPYADLFPRFRAGLRSTDRVVVVGYGFADQAINSYLIQWMSRSCEHKMIVVDPNPERLRAHARPAARRVWTDWMSNDRLVVLPKKGEDVTWSEIDHASA